MFRCVNKKGYLPPGDDTFGEHDDDSLELGVDHWEKLPLFSEGGSGRLQADMSCDSILVTVSGHWATFELERPQYIYSSDTLCSCEHGRAVLRQLSPWVMASAWPDHWCVSPGGPV